ncbi:hypothetical protein JOQ06_000680, partial [Pogonophryne albipinna]
FLLLSPHVHHASIEVHPPAHPSTCQQTAADATSFDMKEAELKVTGAFERIKWL